MSQSCGTNTDYLATLPYELMLALFSHMDIATVETVEEEAVNARLTNPPYSNVIAASNERKSVLNYLNVNFGNGKRLLEAMSRCDVYISGSRSTEFFCPGSINGHSDWDFFIRHNLSYVYHFMQALSDIGVVWLTPISVLNNKLKRDGDNVTISARTFQVLEHHGTIQEKADELGVERADTVGDEDALFCNISVSGGQLRVRYCEPDPGCEAMLGDICITHGELAHGGSVMSIQLITYRAKYDDVGHVRIPYALHSSPVQSFIGPVSAGHMYGKLASERKAYGWDVKGSAPGDRSVTRVGNVMNTKGVRQWNKYENRGFEYMYPPESGIEFTLRSIRDSLSYYIEYDGIIQIPPDVEYLHLQCTRAMAWYQTATRTVPTDFTISTLPGYNALKLRGWFDNATVSRGTCFEYLKKYVFDGYRLDDASSRAWARTHSL